MDFTEALDHATDEYKHLFHDKLRFIKKTEDRVSATNMCFMRGRDIERENNSKSTQEFVFNISTMKEDGTWDRCPKCGDPDINKIAENGIKYQGCYNCHILLGKFQIKSMKSQKKKEKPSDDTPNDNPQS